MISSHPYPIRNPQSAIHNSYVFAVCVFSFPALNLVACEPPIVQPPIPAIAPADQKFLTWIARRALEAELAGRTASPLTYRPPALADVSYPLAVTLRLGGFKRGVGVSPKLPVCEAAGQAALTALQNARSRGPVDSAALERMTIELEAIGDVAPAPTIPSWGSVQSYRFMQRGVHGLVVRFMEAQAALRPSEFIADNSSFQEAVETFAARANPGGEGVEARFVSWFRTAHWVELEPGGEVVELRRGLVLVPPEAVTREGLSRAIDAVAEFMIYRQRPDGEFAYQYNPSSDTYDDEVSDIRQAGCAWSLARFAQTAGGDLSLRAKSAADRSVRRLLPRVTNLRDLHGAAYLRATEGSNKLGATALFSLALSESDRAGQHRPTHNTLTAGIRWLQGPDGRFITVFPPSLEEAGQEYAPGQALLALARSHQDEPRPETAATFEKALPYYRGYFRKSPHAAFAAWQAQAFALIGRLSARREYADFVFELADGLVSQQLTAATCEWPELLGGIDPTGQGDVNVGTATALEALADALALARDLKDARSERYESAARAAARFVMQLQFRREEAFYAHSPRDCVGGIRAAPWDNRIRIEQCAHALRALVRAREVLFGVPHSSGVGD